MIPLFSPSSYRKTSSLLLTTLVFFILFIQEINAQPPNGDCQNATPLTVNGPEIAGTTIGAPYLTWECPGEFSHTGNGVWYSFLGTGHGMTVCAAGASGVDAFAGCGGCVAENGYNINWLDPCGWEYGYEYPDYSIDTVEGQMYYAIVFTNDQDDSTGATATGSFNVSVIDHPVVINDRCPNAVQIAPGEMVSLTPDESTYFRLSSAACYELAEFLTAAWYKVVGTGNIMTFSICNSLTEEGNSRDIFMQDSCDPTAVCLESLNEFYLPPSVASLCDDYPGETVALNTTKGQVYYLSLDVHYGNFGLEVLEYDENGQTVAPNPQTPAPTGTNGEPTAPTTTTQELSTGAVTAIAVCSVVVVIGAAAAILYLLGFRCSKKERQEPADEVKPPPPATQEMAPDSPPEMAPADSPVPTFQPGNVQAGEAEDDPEIFVQDGTDKKTTTKKKKKHHEAGTDKKKKKKKSSTGTQEEMASEVPTPETQERALESV